MSNKLKYAPTPPPEPVITGSLEPGPKKRGRKRTKKQYFTSDTDLYTSGTFSEYNEKLIMNKFAILLALTSNDGHKDFQLYKKNDSYLYEDVIKKSQLYENSNRLMYVVGANHFNLLKNIRRIIPNSFL